MENKKLRIRSILRQLDGLSYLETVEVLKSVNNELTKSLKVVLNSSDDFNESFWYGLFSKAATVYTEPLPKFGKDILD